MEAFIDTFKKIKKTEFYCQYSKMKSLLEEMLSHLLLEEDLFLDYAEFFVVKLD